MYDTLLTSVSQALSPILYEDINDGDLFLLLSNAYNAFSNCTEEITKDYKC